jgi:hypothetical protein
MAFRFLPFPEAIAFCSLLLAGDRSAANGTSCVTRTQRTNTDTVANQSGNPQEKDKIVPLFPKGNQDGFVNSQKTKSYTSYKQRVAELGSSFSLLFTRTTSRNGSAASQPLHHGVVGERPLPASAMRAAG